MRDIQKEFNNTMDHIFEMQDKVAKQAAEAGKKLQSLGIFTKEDITDNKLDEEINLRR